MFYRLQRAAAVDLSNFDTSNVTKMNNMFSYSLIKFNFTNFDTSKVTDMSNMFEGNRSSTLDLSSFVLANNVKLYNFLNNSYADLVYARTSREAAAFESYAYGARNNVRFEVK